MKIRIKSLVLLVIAVTLVVFQVYAADEPMAPTDLKIDNVSTTSLKLTWTDKSADEDGFKVERSIDNLNFTVIITLAANTTSWIDTGLKTGKTYTYRVYAYKGTLNSGYSNSVNATPTNATEVWPVKGDPVVGYTYGEYFYQYDTAADYHWGVDCMGAAATDVYAPFSGKVNRIMVDGTQRHVEIKVGSEYITLGHLQNIPASIVVNANVNAGDKIGEIYNNNFSGYGSHMHIDRMTTTFSDDPKNRMHPLELFTQNKFRDPASALPQIMDRANPLILDTDTEKIQYKIQDGAYITTKVTAPKPGQPSNVFNVNGKIDIIVEAQDEMGHTKKPAALYKLGYWVESKASKSHDIRDKGIPYILHKCSPTLYDGSTQKTSEIYEVSLIGGIKEKVHTYVWTDDTCGHWNVTNTKGVDGAMSNVDAKQCWNTIAKNVLKTKEPNGVDKGDATGAHNAYFQDGHYIVHIKAYDLVNGVDEKDDVWVENFPPHIRSMEVWEDSDNSASTGDAPHAGYERQIYSYTYDNLDDGIGVYPAKTGVDYLKDAQKAIAGSGKGGRKILVQITFSETMDASWADFKLQLDPQGAGAGEAAIDSTNIQWSAKVENGIKTGVENDTVTGVITIPPKKHETIDSKSADYSRDAVIVVKARDTAEKTLDVNSDGTSDTEDRNHKIKIDTKNDVRPDQKPHLKMEK